LGPVELRRYALSVVNAADPDGPEPVDDQLQHDRRHLELKQRRDGMWHLAEKLTNTVGAQLNAILDPLTKPRTTTLETENGTTTQIPDERPHGQRLHDGLDEMGARLLKMEDQPASGGTPGPVHNNIPAPDRNWDGNATDDNSTYWVDDFNRAHYQDLMFGEGESFKDFYLKQSNGRFLAKGDVSDWVSVPYNEAAYGSNKISEANYWLFVQDSVKAWYADQVAQHQHVGVERTGHAGRQQAGAGDEVESEALVVGDGGAGRHGTLAANHLGLATLHRIQDQRHVAAGAAEMRLDHLQGEGGGHGGIESVAATLQYSHADAGGDPVRRGDDAEGADDLRPRGEGIGVDQSHGLSPRVLAREETLSPAGRGG